jgi:hypothetical protein
MACAPSGEPLDLVNRNVCVADPASNLLPIVIEQGHDRKV